MKLITLLLIAFLIRLLFLNQSLWMDEAISGVVVKNYDLSYIWNNFPLGDTHPPLYYILLKIWTSFFGFSDVALRMPSVIFGSLLVLVVFLISRALKIKNSLVPAFLTATSGLLIYYSQEARMYSLSTLLVSLVVYFFITRKFLYFSIASTILLATDYLPTSILLVFWIFVLFDKKRKEYLPRLIYAHIPVILFALYWYPTFKVQTQSTLGYLNTFPEWASVLGGADLKNITLTLIKFVIGRVSFESVILYGLISAFSISYWIFIMVTTGNKKNLLLWLWLLTPILFSFIGANFTPGFSYFRLLFCLPAFYLLLSSGIEGVYSPKIRSYLVVFAFGMNILTSGMYLFNSKFHREDWKSLVAFVESRIEEGEVVNVFYPEPFTPYVWYARSPEVVKVFSIENLKDVSSLYTLDYLMDLTDPTRKNFFELEKLGFRQESVYNFRGTGQVRYWKRY